MNVFRIKLTLILALIVTVGCQKAFSIPAPVPGGPEKPSEYSQKADFLVNDVESFKNVLKLAGPGSIIEWADGEYENLALRMNISGTADSVITLRAQTPGGVVFKGASSLQLSGSHLLAEGFLFKALDSSMKGSVLTIGKGSSDCVIRNCTIDGRGSKLSETDSKWVSLYGTHNEISHCTFLDKRNMGCLLVVWLENGIIPEHRISDNYFYRPYTHYDDSGSAINGQESIRIGTSDFSMSEARCSVSGNHFYRCNGERAEIISNKSCRNLYEGNLFEEGEGALTLRHGNECVVRGNYFLSGGKTEVGGVRIIGERHIVENNVFLNLTGSGYKSALCVVKGESKAALNGYWTVKDCVVRNNVFKDCRYGIVVNFGARASQDSAPQNLKISGNVLLSSKSYMIPAYVCDGTPSDAISWEDNLIYGGKTKGVELDMAASAPEMSDYSEQIENIRKNAGVRW